MAQFLCLCVAVFSDENNHIQSHLVGFFTIHGFSFFCFLPSSHDSKFLTDPIEIFYTQQYPILS
jgi:hypothetical protein